MTVLSSIPFLFFFFSTFLKTSLNIFQTNYREEIFSYRLQVLFHSERFGNSVENKEENQGGEAIKRERGKEKQSNKLP